MVEETTEHAIEAQELVRQFKNGPRAVDGVNLYVATGEIYGFLGPNGAGKSTTVRMLVTLLPPTGGRATVGGLDVVRDGPKVRRIIGVALQEAALDPLLTAREHMLLQAGMNGFSRRDSKKRANELLERVALTGAADRKVGGFSGGMKRRLDLAMALVHHPPILFLDEPTTGLDPKSRSALWDEVARLAREENVTVFLTTQYLEEADVLADRVGIIDSGHIVAEGTPESLKAEIGRPTVEVHPARPEERDRIASVLSRFGEESAAPPETVAVRLENAGALADVVRALDAQRLEIDNLSLRAPTLDDVFLEKTGRPLETAEEESPDAEPVLESEEAVVARAAPFGVSATSVAVKEWLSEVRGAASSGAAGVPVLVVQDGPSAGNRVAVGGRLILGREGVDFVIEDPEASRKHAAVYPHEGSVVVQDLGSMNGTWINGHRITQPTRADPGHTITIGKTSIEVQAMARPDGDEDAPPA